MTLKNILKIMNLSCLHILLQVFRQKQNKLQKKEREKLLPGQHVNRPVISGRSCGLPIRHLGVVWSTSNWPVISGFYAGSVSKRSGCEEVLRFFLILKNQSSESNNRFIHISAQLSYGLEDPRDNGWPSM